MILHPWTIEYKATLHFPPLPWVTGAWSVLVLSLRSSVRGHLSLTSALASLCWSQPNENDVYRQLQNSFQNVNLESAGSKWWQNLWKIENSLLLALCSAARTKTECPYWMNLNKNHNCESCIHASPIIYSFLNTVFSQP